MRRAVSEESFIYYLGIKENGTDKNKLDGKMMEATRQTNYTRETPVQPEFHTN